MIHMLSVLLCLGLCLGQKMRAQPDTLPKPSLRAESSSLVPLGRSMTLRCEGSVQADHYRLEKKQGTSRTVIMNVKPSGIEVKFPIPPVTAKDAGTYYCRYRHSYGWSASSDPLELVVTGLYDPPSLSVVSSPEVTSGHNVTLQCQTKGSDDMFALYKDGEEIARGETQSHQTRSQAKFFIPAVNSTHEGTYQCYTFHSDRPHMWSGPSNSLVLRVTGTVSPSPDSEKILFGLAAGISVGVSAFLILFLYHKHWQHQARLRNGGRETEVKKTTRSSDPEEEIPLEETLIASVNDDRQTEVTRQEDAATPKREDSQEVTYVQLNLNGLKAGAKDSPLSGAVEPNLYAALRGAQPELRGTQDEEAPPHSASAF